MILRTNAATTTVVLLFAAGIASAQGPVGTAFTYQGQLKQDGVPVDGTFDFMFTLNDAAVGGAEIGWVETLALSVANGLFTATLDFGEGAFCGDARWLEVRVRAPGSENYVQLSPRQELTPVPYALALPGLRTESHSTCPNVVGGAVENYVSPGAYGATIAGGGSVNRVTDRYGTVGGGSDNQAGDGAGPPYRSGATVGGGNSNSASGTCSTVGGGHSNAASGAYSIIGGGDNNAASGAGSIVGGGEYNAASGAGSTVGGGDNNVASGFASMVLGGQGNLAGGYYSLAAGVSARVRDPSGSGDDDGDEGTFVWADTTQAFFESTGPDQFLIRASGGVGINTNTPQAALHVGGTSGVDGIMFPDGTLQTTAPTLGLGGSGTIDFVAKFTGGTTLGDSVIYESAGNVGIGTTTPGERLSVAGAIESTSNGFKFPDGTVQTTAAAAGTPAWSLTGNAGTDPATNFVGTTDDQAFEVRVNDARAIRIEANADSPNLIGGYGGNHVDPGVHGAVIGGGGHDEWGLNTITADFGVVGGGSANGASGYATTVGGGELNEASGVLGTVSGGNNNNASGAYSAVGGGVVNDASGYAGTVPGGFLNVAGGSYSFAAGLRARVRDATQVGGGDTDGDEGTFVWADSTDTDFPSTGPDQFLIRASGGVGVNTNNPQATLHIGGTPGVDGIMFPDGTVQTTASTGSGTLGGSGTTGHIAKFSDATTLGDSVLYESAGNVGIGTTTPGQMLSVAGTIESTSNGFKFPDGTVQTTAAASGTSGWGLTGNAGTDPATNFVGTTDDQAFEVRVNNARALRIEPDADSPNLIGGYGGNSVNPGVIGAVVVGGGYALAPNTITRDFAVVVGGAGNSASGTSSAVGGGEENEASGYGSIIGGGSFNAATGFASTVTGGWDNTASGLASMVSGGWSNFAGGDYSFAAGRRALVRNAEQVGGGDTDGDEGTFIWADSTDVDFISDGPNQFLVRAAGGVKLIVDVNRGGLRILPDPASPNVIGGHGSNSVLAGVHGAVVAGGGYAQWANTVTADYAVVGGGVGNEASGPHSTIGGGISNEASGSGSTIGGGGGNEASGYQGTIGGGASNVARGYACAVPGGEQNVAGGSFSFAAGYRAKVRDAAQVGGGDTDGDEGTFVWADSTAADFQSTGPNQFLIRASGGVGIGTASPQAKLHLGGTAGVDGIKFPDSTLQTTAYRAISANMSVDPPALPAGYTAALWITVTGAAVGDAVVANPGTDLWACYQISWARVRAADSIEIRFSNTCSEAADPPASTWAIRVLK